MQLRILCLITCAGLYVYAQDEVKCPYVSTRVEKGRVCRKACTKDSDCRGALKRCRCDNWCGMRCFNPAAKCPQLSAIANGTIAGEQRSYGKSVTYSCNVGFILNGTSTRTCRSDKKWSGSEPVCEGGCVAPTDTRDAFADAYEDSYKIGASLDYICRYGYRLVGSATVTCQADGKWKGSGFRCVKIFCLEPKRIENGYRDGTKYSFGSRVYYRCNKGYETFDAQTYVVCGSNQKWRGTPPTCTPVRCPAPEAPFYGSVDDSNSNYNYGTAITYSCNAGYKLVGSAEATCDENASWGTLPTCVVDKNCDFERFDPPFCGYRDVSSNWIRQFSSNVAKGERGYVARPAFTGFKALDIATLQSPNISRDQAQCLQFNYRIQILHNVNDFIVKIKDGAELWKLPVTNVGRRWLSTDVRIPAFVGSSSLQFVVKSVNSKTSTSIELDNIKILAGNQCVKDCADDTCKNDGKCLDLIGGFACICLARWSGKRCEAKKTCKVPPAPKFGSVTPSQGQVNVYGLITYACKIDYRLEGISKASCGSNTLWSSDPPTCISQCRSRNPPSNLIIRPRKASYDANEEVTFYCTSGFALQGTDRSTCNSNKQWSTPVPSCQRLVGPTPQVQTKCPKGYTESYPLCYKVSDLSTTYENAKASCANDGATLPVITTLGTQRRLDELVTANKTYWLGLDRSKRGALQWTSGDRFSETTYSRFRAYNLPTAQSACFYMDAKSVWYHTNCAPNKGTICMKWQTGVTPLRVRVSKPRSPAMDGFYFPIAGALYYSFPMYKHESEPYYIYTRSSYNGKRSRTIYLGACPKCKRKKFTVRTKAPFPQDISEKWYINGSPATVSVSSYDAWGFWSQWSACSCRNPGVRTRTRTCVGHQANSIHCPGESSNTRPCTYCTVEHGNKIFSIRYDKKLTFNQARAECQRDGGDLAMIKSGEIQKILAEKVDLVKGKIRNYRYFYLGMTADNAREWTWLDSEKVNVRNSRPGFFSNWDPIEPNDSGGIEDCGVMYVRTKNWNDVPCSGSYNFFCETTDFCQSSPCLNNAISCRSDTTTFTCKCQDGYSGKRCETHQPTTCRDLSDPLNGRKDARTDATNTVGAIFAFSCSLGYELVGQRTTQCDTNGRWTFPEPTCIQPQMDCRLLNPPSNGGMTARDPSVSLTKSGSIVDFKCNSGYKLIGKSVVVCGKDGKWTYDEPTCKQRGCRGGVDRRITASTFPGREYEVGKKLDASCESNSFKITCMGNNKWHPSSCWSQWNSWSPCQCSLETRRRSRVCLGGDSTKCLKGKALETGGCFCALHEPARCQAPQPLDNGQVQVDGHGVGSKANYSCEAGYTLNGTESRVCGPEGAWSGEAPLCEGQKCTVASLKGFVPVDNNKAEFVSGESVSVRCRGNQSITFNVTCSSDGQWSTEGGNC